MCATSETKEECRGKRGREKCHTHNLRGQSVTPTASLFFFLFTDVTGMKACATADAAIAGALGAAAALCGKIAFDGRAARALVVRGAAAAGLAGATVCAESVFARALAAADSSLVPTVVSVSTNFVISVCPLVHDPHRSSL